MEKERNIYAVVWRTSIFLDRGWVKELRRLAEQRGLTGVSDLRKKELLAALRQQITSSPASEKADTVVVERTLDLTETDDLAAEATVLE